MTPERLSRMLPRRRSPADVGPGAGDPASSGGGDRVGGPLRCIVCGGEIEPGLAALASVSCHECRPAHATHVLSR
jgi:hypothetical protein